MKRIKKYLILFLMIMLTLPDVVWAAYNLVLGGCIYFIGYASQDKALKQYGFNVAISVDQFFATKAFGQDPDVTISDFLGRLKDRHEKGTARVGGGWLFFGYVVDLMFWFQPDHVTEAIEHDEKMGDSVVKFHESIHEEKIK